MPDKITYQDFAKRIKEKYPQYIDLDDSTLTSKIIAKYPQYKETVDFEIPENEGKEYVEDITERQNVMLGELDKRQFKSYFPESDYMGLFNKKEEFKLANNKDISMSFANQVGLAASQAERPPEFLFDANSLKKRLEAIPKYFPQLTDQSDELKKQLLNINSQNIDDLKQSVTDLEKQVMQLKPASMMLGQQMAGDPNWSKYENEVLKDKHILAGQRLMEDTERLKELAEIPLTREQEGFWDKTKAAIKGLEVGKYQGAKDYVTEYNKAMDDFKAYPEINKIYEKIEKLNNNEDVEFTTDERLLMQLAFDNALVHEKFDDKISTYYKIGEAFGKSMGYQLEFLLTSKVGGKPAAAITKLIKPGMKAVPKYSLLALSKLTQAGIQTPTMPSFYKLAAQNASHGMSYGEAVLNAYWEMGAETLSERIFMKPAGSIANLNSFNKFLARTGINIRTDKGALGVILSMIEETGEEKISEILTAPKNYKDFGEFWKGFWDAEDNAVMLGSVSLMVGGMGSASVLGNSYIEAKRKGRLARYEKFVPTDLRAEIDAVLEIEDLSVKDQYDLIADAISDRIETGDLGEDPATTAGNAMAYMNYRIQDMAAETVNKKGQVEGNRLVVGKAEEGDTEAQQAQLDYLKQRGVEVPEGTKMDELGKLYDTEVAKETAEVEIDEAETPEQIEEIKGKIEEDVDLLKKLDAKKEFITEKEKLDESLDKEEISETEYENKLEKITDTYEGEVAEKIEPVKPEVVESDFDKEGDLTDSGFEKATTILTSTIDEVSDKYGLPKEVVKKNYNISEKGEYVSMVTPILNLGEGINEKTFRKIVKDIAIALNKDGDLDKINRTVNSVFDDWLSSIENGTKFEAPAEMKKIFQALIEINKLYQGRISEELNIPQKETTVKPETEKNLAEKKTEISEIQPTETEQVEEKLPKKETVKEKVEEKLPETVTPEYEKLTTNLGIKGKTLTKSLGKSARNGKIGGVSVILQQGTKENEVILESIKTPKYQRGTGKATNAMNKIIAEADKQGLTIKLRAVPEKGADISQENLIKFYQDFGFEFKEGSIEGVRTPKKKGVQDAEKIGTPTQEAGKQTQELEQGEEGRLRVRQPSQERLETEKGEKAEEISKKSILKSKKDLLGDDILEEYMRPVEYSKSLNVDDELLIKGINSPDYVASFRGYNQDGDIVVFDKKRGNQYSIKNKNRIIENLSKKDVISISTPETIQYAVDNGVYDEWIKEGRISTEDVRTIIESANIEVPERFTEKPEAKPTDKFGILNKLNRRVINTTDGLFDGIRLDEIKSSLKLYEHPYSNSIERNELFERINKLAQEKTIISQSGNIGGKIELVRWFDLLGELKAEKRIETGEESKQAKPTEKLTSKQREEAAKAKIAEGFSNLAETIGAKKSLTGEERETAIQAIQRILEGLIELGIAKGMSLKDAVLKYAKDNNFKIQEDLLDEAIARREKPKFEKPAKKEPVTPEQKLETLRETIKKKAKTAREGATQLRDVKNYIIDEIKTALKEKGVTELTRGQATQLLNKVRKATKFNIEKVAIEATDLIDKIYTNKKIKTLISDIDKQLKTKTVERTEKGIKKAKGVPKEVKYYLDKAKSLFNLAKQLRKDIKIPKTLIVTGKTKYERDAQELEHKLLSEQAEQTGRDNFKEAIDDAIMEAQEKQLSDDMIEREQGIYEEIAARDMQDAFERNIDKLKDINENIKRTIKEGRAKLKEEIQKEINRKNEIREFGRESTKNEFTGKTKLEIQRERFEANNKKIKKFFVGGLESFEKYFSNPIKTSLEFLLKYIESGNFRMQEGKIYQYFMKGVNGWLTAHENRLRRKREIFGEIEIRLKNIAGVNWVGYHLAKWSETNNKTGIYRIDEQGEREKIPEAMSIGQGAYLYAMSKMENVKERLLLQGWDDTAIEQVKTFIGKDVVDFVDYITEELFPQLHKDYNKTYLDIYKTPLDIVKNYFPLLYDSLGSVTKESEIVIGENKFALPSITPNHIKSRVQNLNEISATANFFEVMYNYIGAMEKFHNYSRFVRDMNALLTDNEFRKNLENNDPRILSNLIDAINRAIENDRTFIDDADLAIHQLNRATAFAKIAIRSWTALKQYLSLPAFFELADQIDIKIGNKNIWIPGLGTAKFAAKAIHNILNPVATYRNHKFFMKNSEFYRARIEKGDIGDEEISKGFVTVHKVGTTRGKFLWREVAKSIGRVGIFMNKMVDAHTISAGGKAYYDQQFSKYKKIMSEENAHKQAMHDFDLNYNLTQQSSLPAFLSQVQGKKGLMKSIFATFKNAQFSYYRKFLEGSMDLLNGYIRTVDRYEKQFKDAGISSESAKMKARAMGLKYLATKNAKQDFKKMAIYGYVLPVVWQYALSGLPGLLTEWDDDDTDEISRALRVGFLDNMFIIGDITKFAYDAAVLGKVQWDYQPSQLIQTINDGIKDIAKAFSEEGTTNFEIALELGRQLLITKGIDFENLGIMYDGAEALILRGEWTKENILKLLTAPKSMIKQIEKEKKGETEETEETERVIRGGY